MQLLGIPVDDVDLDDELVEVLLVLLVGVEAVLKRWRRFRSL